MIKVLQIIDGNTFGGIAKLMMDVEKNINQDFKFDFLTATNICDKWNNLNISRQSLKGKMIYNYKLFKYLKNSKYDIVHINSGAFFFTFQVVWVCKLAKIKKIVVHSHNTPYINKTKKILLKILNPLYRKMIDAKLACSKGAAQSLFNKTEDVLLIKNGIDIEKFKYNKMIREEYRKKLGIEGKIVYGHVGRFDKQKNHEFLIDLFFNIQKKQDAVLLLVGNGELKAEFMNKVKKLNIEEKVLFLGFREDINNLLNSMDYFLLPSLYEGLGIVLIEAQTSGLPVFVSSGIPDEANISNNFYKINKFNINEWTDIIINTKTIKRINSYNDTIKAGYDINDSCKDLEHIYYELVN